MRHRYEISVLVSQTSFGGETSSSVAKCRLFLRLDKSTLTVIKKLELSLKILQNTTQFVKYMK